MLLKQIKVEQLQSNIGKYSTENNFNSKRNTNQIKMEIKLKAEHCDAKKKIKKLFFFFVKIDGQQAMGTQIKQ